jgi:hypothetical protein
MITGEMNRNKSLIADKSFLIRLTFDKINRFDIRSKLFEQNMFSNNFKVIWKKFKESAKMLNLMVQKT